MFSFFLLLAAAFGFGWTARGAKTGVFANLLARRAARRAGRAVVDPELLRALVEQSGAKASA